MRHKVGLVAGPCTSQSLESVHSFFLEKEDIEAGHFFVKDKGDLL